MRDSGLYENVPGFVDYETEKAAIETRDQLYLRERQLKRINRGDALRPVETAQGTVPYYLKHEVDIATRTANRQREKIKRELYPNWDDMTDAQRGRAMSNRNLNRLRPDYTDQGLRDIWGERHWYDETKLNIWLNTWKKYSDDIEGYSPTVDIIKRFQETKQTALYQILESDDDEKEPEYVYPESAYGAIPFEIRQANVIRFWARMADRYGLYDESQYDKVKRNRWDVVIG